MLSWLIKRVVVIGINHMITQKVEEEEQKEEEQKEEKQKEEKNIYKL